MSRRVRLRLAYDGTAYAGWQRQKNAVTVQQKLEEAFEALFHEKITADASGRTDAGVHAWGQVAAVTLEHPIPVERLALALNSRLPEDIRVLEAQEAPADFHPQFQAKQKTYRYTFYTGPFLLPQYRLYMAHIPEELDLERMRRAASALVGEHDFAALSSAQRTSKTSVRTIYEVKIFRDDGDEKVVHIEVTGNGFLYNMVRIIAGTLADIGRGRMEIETLRQAMENKDRTLAGVTAPPQGLALMRVEYESQGHKKKEEVPLNTGH